jgi:hypothetical protein
MPSISFGRNKSLFDGGSAAGLEIKADASADLLAAIAGRKPFPSRDIEVAKGSLSFQGGRDLTFTSERGKVTFKGAANAFAALGVFSDSAKVRALLRADEHVANGLTFGDAAGHRLLVLRWGYDVTGSARSAMALGAGGAVTLGVEGARDGLYAVVHRFDSTEPAAAVLGRAASSWRPPALVETAADLDPGTWLAVEVDGSIAVTLATTFGYDFSWVGETELGQLKGDIGLKLQLGLAASVGFTAKSRYCVVVARESEREVLRLSLFKLSYKGVKVAGSATATAEFKDAFLPATADDFVKGVFGVRGEQIIKVLGPIEKWAGGTDPIPEALAGLTSDYLQRLLTELTGVDAATKFDAARGRLLDLFATWDRLPAKASGLVFKLVEENVDLGGVRKVVSQAARADQASLKALVDAETAKGSFFTRPEGRVLESLATGPLLTALTHSGAFASLSAAARELDHLLDPQGALVDVLVNLQKRIDTALHLDQIETIASETDFQKLDALFRRQLSEFLGKTFDVGDVVKVRQTIALLAEKKNEYYDKAKAALKRKYTFEFAAAYERASTDTALIDAEFDFGAAQPGLDALWADALAGTFDRLFLEPRSDVALHTGALTHGVTRHTHVEVSLPFFKGTIDHVNTALASARVEEEGGRVIVYEVTAEDLVSTTSLLPRKKTFRDSRLTIGAFLPTDVATRQLRVHSTDAMTYTYSFDQARTNMKRGDLQFQIKPLVTRFFPDAFPEGTSFDTWITDLDKTIDTIEHNGSDNFGNTLLTLDLTLPSRVPAAWLSAPADPSARPYMRMSRNIQGALKALIPPDFFQDRRQYDGANAKAAALMIYAAIPPSTSISLDGGKAALSRDADVYWDIAEPRERDAMMAHPLTVAGLVAAMKDVHDMLAAIGRRSDAAFYQPGELGKIIGAVQGREGHAHLMSLLQMEQDIIHAAHQAGLRMAAFRSRAGTSPREAIDALEGFGSALTSAFNAKVASVYGGGALRTLGTMLFVAAARGLSDDLQGIQPAGLLRLTVLRQSAAFPPAGFPNVIDLAAADVVVDQQFVTTGN